MLDADKCATCAGAIGRPAVLALLSQEAHLVDHGVPMVYSGIIEVFRICQTVLGRCRYC